MSWKLFALVFVFVATATSAVKVPITIYYESLCPDSAKFIREQVYPAVKQNLRDYIDITWVPFGKSQSHTLGSDVTFDCHHGPNECYGNKIHACAIEHIQANSYQTEFTRESLTLDFINCMMGVGKSFPDQPLSVPGERCARDNHISTWETINQCANSTEGSQLLRKHGETTNTFQYPLESVPTVAFKQKNDKESSQLAMTNFLGIFCKNVPMPQPRVCAALNAAPLSYSISSTILMFIVAGTLSVGAFFKF